MVPRGADGAGLVLSRQLVVSNGGWLCLLRAAGSRVKPSILVPCLHRVLRESANCPGSRHVHRDHPLLRARGPAAVARPQPRASGSTSPSHLERLQFIRHCRGLDMSLDEIGSCSVGDAPADCNGDVNSLLDEHIEHVSRRTSGATPARAPVRELAPLLLGEVRPIDQCGIPAGMEVAAQKSASADGGHQHLRSVHRPRAASL